MSLSVISIKAAKGRDKSYKLTDSGGLYLLVKPCGQRYWRLNYRFLRKQKTMCIGVWPDTGLADARDERDAARKLLARGQDLIELAKQERAVATIAASNDFKAVTDEVTRQRDAVFVRQFTRQCKLDLARQLRVDPFLGQLDCIPQRLTGPKFRVCTIGSITSEWTTPALFEKS